MATVKESLNGFINGLAVIDTQSHRNLTINFLRQESDCNLDIRSFADAVADNSIIIKEVDEVGNVPELNFRNDGDRPVFVGEGSIIEGLKQNRTIRMSFVIRQREELFAPVYCVEEARWSVNSLLGRKSPYHLDTRSRVLNLRKSNQNEMWDNISDRMNRTGTRSRTGYFGDIYEHSKIIMAPYQKAFICPDNAVGFIAQIDGRVVALDVFATSSLMAGNFHSVLAGPSLDATDSGYCKFLSMKKGLTVKQFLKAIEDAPKERHDGIGQGHIIKFASNMLIGSALNFEDNFIHTEAFAV